MWLLAVMAAMSVAPRALAQIYDQPGSVTSNEDTQATFNFKVAAWGIYRNVSVTSDNQALVPNGNISSTEVRSFYEFPSQRTEWRVTYTPAANAAGKATFTLKATDGAAVQSTATVTVNITQVEDPPRIMGVPANASISEDGTYLLEFQIADLESVSQVQLATSSSNPSLVPNASANLQVATILIGAQTNVLRLSAMPVANGNGTTDIRMVASQGGHSVTNILRLTVNAVNDPPVLTVANQTMTEDVPFTVPITVNDVDSPATSLILSVASSNTGLVPHANLVLGGSGTDRNVTITPLPNVFGTFTVSVSASDPAGAFDLKSFTVTINSANDLPVAGSPTALALDGVDDHARAQGIGLSAGNTPHTIEAWVQPDAPNSVRQWILHLGAAGTGHHWLLQSDGTLQLGAWGSVQVQGVPLPLGQWTHLAAVWDGSLYTVYVNGVKVSQIASATGFNMSPPDLWLGAKFTAEAQFKGQLDEVRVWNRPLTETEIQSGMNIPLRGSEAGLLVYLPFNEKTGATGYDYASLGGRANAALFNGASYVNRHESAGILLDGADDRVSIDHHAVFNGYPMSVTAWIRTTDDNGAIASKYGDGSINGWTFRIVSGRLRAWYFGTGGYIYNFGEGFDGGLISDGRWHLVAFTVDAAGGRIYVDGVQTGFHPWLGTPSGTTSPEPLQLGCYHTGFTNPGSLLSGSLDDVGYWNKALTPGEIQSLWEGLYHGTGNLVAFYSFAEASGTTAVDFANLVAGVNNGNLVGGISRGPAATGPAFGTYVVNEETPSKIYLQGFDTEFMLSQAGGAPITYTIVTPPVHGTLQRGVLVLTAGSVASWTDEAQNPLTYTPAAAFNGMDSFTYKLTDGGSGESSTVTVPIHVQELNDIPTITPITDRVIEEGTSTGPIAFTVGDEETPAADLKVAAFASDPRLVPTASIVEGGSGANRTLTITPVTGEIGTTTITVTVRDTAVPAGLATWSFKLRVDSKPAYALVDLGALDLLNLSFGHDINDNGWAVGVAQSQSSDGHALLNRGLRGTGVAEDLDPGHQGFAYGINNTNEITGFFRPTANGLREAFIWRNGTLTTLSSRITGSDSIGFDLNTGADVVGSFRLPNGSRRGFFLPSVGSMIDLGVVAGFTANSEALGLDRNGRVAGYSQATDGRSRAFLWSGSSPVNLGVLSGETPAHDDSRAYAINDAGVIVGYSSPNKEETSPRRAFVYENSVMRSLGILPGGTLSEAWDINNFGQVVGRADRATKPRAFVYSAGTMRDLNDLIHDTRVLDPATGQIVDFEFAGSGWDLQEARAINTAGAIVGAGVKAGKSRAFLAVPAWVIGKQIARPEGAVERLPEIEILYGTRSDTPQNSFHWSDFEKKLYAIRPVTARIKWFTSFQDTVGSGTNIQVNTDRILVEGISVWPKDPNIHVAQAPVEVEPKGVPFNYGYQAILYQTPNGTALVDPTSKSFNASTPAYSVLYYLETRGAQPNPATQHPQFEIVRTVAWNAQDYLLERTATVGTPLMDPPSAADPGHKDYLGKNGFVFFENAYYDGLGPDRAYDRGTRLGPIIPVNLDTQLQDDDLVVVWYRLSRLGVAWASVPVRYSVSWPADEVVERIIIASGEGSGPLPTSFSSARAYSQPIADKPGYNPNEEHAFVAPAANGEGIALFALRNDLNDWLNPKASEPYALLKYRNGTTGEWQIQVYKVVAEEDPHFFEYEGIAGTEIRAPYPLSLLSVCGDSRGVAGPWWEDWRGTLYARAGGAFGESTDIRIQWFYPLQPGFFYDLDLDGDVDVEAGACVAWLDRHATNALVAPNSGVGTPGTPIDVTYHISWPETPVLQIGETLMKSKNGLPGVGNMASLKFIYDDLSPEWNPLNSSNPAPVSTLASLYDPISSRVYKLSAGEEIPPIIKKTNRGGKEYFDDLPPALETRLVYDPINKWLIFSGILDGSGAGEPLLLPNVLSSRERDAVKRLAPGNAAWSGIVDKLYNITRNPNNVDLAPRDGAADAYTDASDPSTNLLPGLRLGLTTRNGRVVPETFGDQPKALTAALGGITPPTNRPINALFFDGNGSAIDAGAVDLNGRSFTLELWAKRSSVTTIDYVAGMGSAEPTGQLMIGFDASNRFVFRFGESTDSNSVFTASVHTDTNWHHWAVTFDAASLRQAIYIDGGLVAEKISESAFSGAGSLLLGRRFASGENDSFHGTLDEIRVWDHARGGGAIARDRIKSLTGHEDGLVRYYRCDRLVTGRYADDSPHGVHAQASGSVNVVSSDAPTAQPPRYMVLAENDDPSLGGLPIQLHIIRIDDGPFQGDLKVIYPGNVFDQRLTLRHSSDFGGEPGQVQFEWYYKPDVAGFDPSDLPVIDAAGSISDLRGWLLYTNIDPLDGQGVNDVTIGQGSESGLLTLGDNWFVCRLRGFNVHGEVPWSGWIGDPSGGGTPRAQLAEGWIKRVIRGLNPFDARTAEFHSNPTATYASMILEAGERYEGDIAFNPSGENLNSLGLIEAYATVLERGKRLSVGGTPPVNFAPANKALLLATTRISDLYMLLGNEAYADAQDPTIGFTTSEAPYHALASSIFAFQNQLDSLLEEELTLLRGRDETHAGVAARPVYNRLFWNFTLGEGEVAYQQNYNINDNNFDGFIDERDARRLYPQGHGDAWGHYLTAIKSYYELLRHPQYTWIPQTERVLVAGVPVEVDYSDERKFARAAAMKAKAGAEIVDLTYRANYVDDPDGQWQGYKDTDPERAWGVAEWAWRAGQSAYFDWLTANTILPSVDPNTNHVGIQRIDRMTVTDLDEIIAQYNEIQTVIDHADVGLNPLGLVKGAMILDLDPTFLAVGSTAAIGRQAVQGLAHFEQLNERAIKALKNAQRVWDEANAQSRNLRETQDSVDEFTANVRDQEINYRNQLIEIFGYPYAGDIGPGKTYPSGYSGPDLYHYMYVPVTEITGQTVPPSTNYIGFFTNVVVGLMGNSFFPSEDKAYFTEYTIAATDPTYLPINYPQNEGPWAFSAPQDWGQRRAPGKVQEAISDVLQATARLKFAGQNYDGLILDIDDRVKLLQARFNLDANKLKILNRQRDITIGLNAVLGTMNGVQTGLRRAANVIRDVTAKTIDSIPKVVGLATDALAPARAIINGVSVSVLTEFEVVADGIAVAQNAIELGKETLPLTTEIELTQEDQRYEVLQQVKELEALVRNEINLRLEVFEQEEVLRQAYGRYLAAISEGQRVLDEMVRFRKEAAAQTTEYRYRDMAFRIFRNEALQKYRSTFDLAARYVYLCATAYDYESNFLGSDRRAASRFYDQIIRQRQLGVLIDGEPIPGDSGLADIQGRMIQNWEILEPQFGLNNPQLESGRFSLRSELFRLRDQDPDRLDDATDNNWRTVLRQNIVKDVWDIPEFRRYCRPFALESAGPQPALVLRFPTTIQFGQNFFGKPLSGGDSAFDPTFFSTKINAVGIGFPGYDDAGLSRTPRIYFFPVGLDVLRAPTGSSLATREWRVLDQAVPVPFAIGANDFTNPSWIPSLDALSENYGQPRRFAALRAFSDNGDFEEAEMSASTRLVARSVWNTEWMLIIPGGTLLSDPDEGLARFVNSVSDIRLLMMVYSFAGQ